MNEAHQAKNSSSNNGTTRKPTRHQAIVSCLECRRMKWKCDRKFPCGNCRKRGIESMCPDGQLRPLKGQYLHAAGETEALRNRIAYLEGLLAQAQEQGFDLELTQGRTSRTQAESASMNGLSLSRSKQEGQVGRGHEDEALIDEGRDGEDIEDGQLIVGEDPGSSSFFGNAGAHYHLHLNGDGSQRNPSPSLPDLPAEWLDTFPLPCTAPLSVKNLVSSLPDRASAAKWAVIYFEDAAILNYSVDPDHFWAHLFPRAYPPDDIPLTPALNSHELGLIYLVLATGVAMDLSLPPYNETAETLFKLGRMALSIDPSDSILFVQSIHIMSRYLSNSFRGPKATLGFWSCLGMAVRSAQSMGLHRDGRRWKLPAEEIETRRRVFWEIYTEDVLQSMTQARPRLISLATMDCAVPQCASDQHDVDGRLLFHHYKYRLCKILSKVNDVQVSVDPVPYKEILAIHDGLREFEDELPPILRTDHPKNNVHHSLVWHRLTLRLLNMEGYLFLHRAHFARALRDCSQEPMSSPFRFSYVAELEASRVILLILQEALATNQQIACRFLIFFFHAFTAIVNFAAVVVRSPKSSLARAAFAQVENGVRLFESIQAGFKARDDLPRLRTLLEQARDSLDQVGRGQESASNVDVASFGFGSKLVRLQTRHTPQLDHSVRGQLAFDQNTWLPTTLADATRLTQHAGVTQDFYSTTLSPDQSTQDSELQLFTDWLSTDWSMPSIPQEQVGDLNTMHFSDPSNADQDIHDFLINIGLDPAIE